MPTDFDAFQTAFFHIYEQPQFDGQTFLAYLDKIKRLVKQGVLFDERDERVLDLYEINDAAWRAKIMDSVPVDDEAGAPETTAKDDEIAL